MLVVDYPHQFMMKFVNLISLRYPELIPEASGLQMYPREKFEFFCDYLIAQNERLNMNMNAFGLGITFLLDLSWRLQI